MSTPMTAGLPAPIEPALHKPPPRKLIALQR
jgi:hypothetical protein